MHPNTPDTPDTTTSPTIARIAEIVAEAPWHSASNREYGLALLAEFADRYHSLTNHTDRTSWARTACTLIVGCTLRDALNCHPYRPMHTVLSTSDTASVGSALTTTHQVLTLARSMPTIPRLVADAIQYLADACLAASRGLPYAFAELSASGIRTLASARPTAADSILSDACYYWTSAL